MEQREVKNKIFDSLPFIFTIYLAVVIFTIIIIIVANKSTVHAFRTCRIISEFGNEARTCR